MKRQFAEVLLPATLRDSKTAFFSVITSDRGTEAFREVFANYAEQLGQKPLPAALEALQTHVFQEAGHIVILMEYPGDAAHGEPHMGAMVFGPFQDGTFNSDTVATAPVAYYLLVQQRDGTQIAKLSGNHFVGVGPGPGTDRQRFVDWVVRSFSESGNVEDVPNDDPAMEKAIRHAQETLPEVTERFVAGELQDFTVKVLIEADRLKEHFWLTGTEFANGEFSGTIEEEGRSITQIVPGTYIEAPPSQVTDWMYVENGKMVGNHTLRAMMERMPPAQRAKYAQHLAGYVPPTPTALPPPLPPSRDDLEPFSFAHSLRGWPDLKVLRKRCRQVVGSRQLLSSMYKRMHVSPLMCAGIYIVGKWKKQDVSGALRAIKSRGTRNPFLRDGYRSLSWSGEILIAHPIIANTMLSEEEDDIAVPGLMLGCYENDEQIQAQAARLAARIGTIYMEGAENSADTPLEELVRDDTYVRWRRRVIPPQYTDGVRMELFDTLLFPGQLPPRFGPIPFLFKKAKPGKRAPILHIPWDVVKVIAEH